MTENCQRAVIKLSQCLSRARDTVAIGLVPVTTLLHHDRTKKSVAALTEGKLQNVITSAIAVTVPSGSWQISLIPSNSRVLNLGSAV
jgi:hypothetical protein